MQFAYPYEAHRRAGIPVQGQSWRAATYSDEDLAQVMLDDCHFEDVVFERADLRRALFTNCVIERCEFRDCRLEGIVFSDCTGAGIRIVGGSLAELVIAQTQWDRLAVEQSGAQLAMTESRFGAIDFNGDGTVQRTLTLSGVSMERLRAENAVWTDATAVALDLAKCDLAGASLTRATFINADGRKQDLRNVSFESCNLYRSDLSGSRLSRATRSIFAECNLEDADFSDAELEGALFASARAARACFDGAKLTSAMFPKAQLQDASFRDVSARTSVWTEADLTGARLARLDAFQSVFRNACLAKADCTGASFVSADLHGVQESLEGADTRDARGTLDWRAEVERDSRGGDAAGQRP